MIEEGLRLINQLIDKQEYVLAFSQVEAQFVLALHLLKGKEDEKDKIALHLSKCGCSIVLLMLMNDKTPLSKLETMLKRLLACCKTSHCARATGLVLNDLGIIQRKGGKTKTALASFQRSCQLAEECSDYDAAATCHLNISAIQNSQGNHSEALKHAKNAVEACKSQNRVDNHGEIPFAVAYYNLAVEYEHQKKPRRAKANYQKALIFSKDEDLSLLIQNALKELVAKKAQAKSSPRHPTRPRSPSRQRKHARQKRQQKRKIYTQKLERPDRPSTLPGPNRRPERPQTRHHGPASRKMVLTKPRPRTATTRMRQRREDTKASPRHRGDSDVLATLDPVVAAWLKSQGLEELMYRFAVQQMDRFALLSLRDQTDFDSGEGIKPEMSKMLSAQLGMKTFGLRLKFCRALQVSFTPKHVADLESANENSGGVEALLFPVSPKAAVGPALFREGDIVEGNVEGRGRWHRGKIVESLANGSYNIVYDDGHREAGVAPSLLRQVKAVSSPIVAAFQRNQRVECKFRGRDNGRWLCGRIASCNPDGTFDVLYDDGDREVSSHPGNIRALVSAKSVSSSLPLVHKVDETVEVNFHGRGMWYVGRISSVNKKTYDVVYEDGDRENQVLPENVRAVVITAEVRFKVHDEVEGNYKRSGNWFKAKITFVNADGSFHLLYDDGDREKFVDGSRVRPVQPPLTLVAVTQMQKIVRGFLARRRYCEEAVKRELELEEAVKRELELEGFLFEEQPAIVIPSPPATPLRNAEGKGCVSEVPVEDPQTPAAPKPILKLSSPNVEEERRKSKRAATLIQSRLRGLIARKQVRSLKSFRGNYDLPLSAVLHHEIDSSSDDCSTSDDDVALYDEV